MSQHLNRVVVTGNLTKDPELRELPSGSSVCKMRIAVNSRRKNAEGEWEDKPNFLGIAVWGKQGEAASEHLSKGSAVAVDGRLEWREWQTSDGSKRESVEIIAETVAFI